MTEDYETKRYDYYRISQRPDDDDYKNHWRGQKYWSANKQEVLDDFYARKHKTQTKIWDTFNNKTKFVPVKYRLNHVKVETDYEPLEYPKSDVNV